MNPTLQAGLRETVPFEVNRERTIGFMGEKATARVDDLEIACRNLLLKQLDAGEDSVGTRVELDHLAAKAAKARLA